MTCDSDVSNLSLMLMNNEFHVGILIFNKNLLHVYKLKVVKM